ncbi:MAG: hypothetical protein AAGB04_00240 [Pseudomonadota bacterium]
MPDFLKALIIKALRSYAKQTDVTWDDQLVDLIESYLDSDGEPSAELVAQLKSIEDAEQTA